MGYIRKHFLVFVLFYTAMGNPVRRTVTPTAQGSFNNNERNTNDLNKATQIGTEQGVVSVAPNNINTNNINDYNANTNTNMGQVNGIPNNNNPNNAVPAANGQEPVVDAKLDEDHPVKSVATKGELQQSLVHSGGEIEDIYTGKPEDIEANKQKGIKQPIQTIIKPDGEVEKIYEGAPNNKTSLEENKHIKGATATLAHDTFNISIPLKPRKPLVVKYLGNETEGVYVKSPASENFKLSCVREHNKKRAIHNAHSIVWSDKLAESAQTWADHLAEIDDDIQDTTNKKFGENIFWTRPELPEDELCKAAVDEWYNEVKLYDFSASHKRNYDAEPVNEFTQLVYDGETREVGVAYSLSRSNKQYVVARYYHKRNSKMLDTEVHPPHSDRLRVRFDRPIFQSYNMIVRLPRISWVPQYKLSKSPAYQRLESKMKNAFKATFQESPTVTSLVDFKLNDFKLDDRKPGSTAILADIDVKFYPYVSDPIQRLRNSIFNGQLNGMEMDDNFLKVFNKTGVYEPPPSWKSKMQQTEMQADAVTGVTDPITGAPTNLTYPQPISEDIDLLDRKPCKGGICETYLIKDRQTKPTNNSAFPIPGGAGQGGQQCCNQMPPPQPCLALACPPPPPTPPCNPNCGPPSGGAQACPMPACPNNCCLRSNILYRRGGITFENHGN